MGKKPWFRPKAFGYGWTPATWQGWTVLAACVAVLVLIRVLVVHSASTWILIIIAFGALFYGSAWFITGHRHR